MSLLSLVKKNLRARLVIAWLVVVIVVYVVLNGYLLKHMGSVGDLASVRGANSELAELKDRIKRLESSIDSSINSVKQLNESISQALKSLNNKSPVAPPARQTVNTDETRIAVLVIACHRPTAIKNHLDQLIEKRGKSSRMIAKFPIIVSQDCNHAETAQVIESFGDSLHAFVKQPDQSDIAQDGNKPVAVHMRGYYKISRHYKFALDQAFLKFNFSSVIITEDDLNVAADFFDYFATMHKVLVADSTLYCVSAWNDNGKKDTIDSSARDLVHRSDFFPGLGWMLQRSLWTNELAAKWPSAFWDDWLRLNEQRKNRACLRPEISRTEMSIQSAKQGVSNGQFLDKFLSKINMNNEPVDWSSKNVDNLIKTNYDPVFMKQVYSDSTEMTFQSYLKANDLDKDEKSVLLLYETKDDFVKMAKYFDIMEDFKDGIPRTAYQGVVSVYFHKKRIYIAPKAKLDWKGYDNKW